MYFVKKFYEFCGHQIIKDEHVAFYLEKEIRLFGQYNHDHPFSLFLKNNILVYYLCKDYTNQ